MQHCIVYGARASAVEHHAARVLAADLAAVLGGPVPVHVEDAVPPAQGSACCYVIGTAATCDRVAQAIQRGDLPAPEAAAEAGHLLCDPRRPIVYAYGHDPAGARRAVYAFVHDILGIDPCAYWTGMLPAPQPDFAPPALDRPLPAPAFPIRCYFDNDNDELANLTQPYLEFDRDTWIGVIETLLRLGYNAIDLHDHLGRSEFYRWDEYKALRPDYHTNLALLDWVIDLAHARGMLIQIPMYLAWEFRHLGEDEAVCWSQHQEKWKALWRYYLQETPLGKGDLFLDRPRSQLWDYEYRSACGEETGAVMTEVFTALRDIVLAHNPNAILVCDLYTHGMDLWRGGTFNPPKDYLLLWPNDGWGRLHPFPEDTRGYRFGAYMHAGYWLNHVVQDPYPVRIAESLRALACDHAATACCLVNGQTFRPFLLNLEAYGRAMADPVGFDGEAFQRAWATRYFGEAAAPHAVQALRALHAASGDGYVRLMFQLVALEKACLARERVADPVALRAECCASAERLDQLESALHHAGRALALSGDDADRCHDMIELPIRLLAETLALHNALQGALLAWNEYLHGDAAALAQANARAAAAVRLLEQHLATRATGDRDPRWQGWYNPVTRRPNGGFPSLEKLRTLRFD
jgi:hypothetical protein